MDNAYKYASVGGAPGTVGAPAVAAPAPPPPKPTPPPAPLYLQATGTTFSANLSVGQPGNGQFYQNGPRGHFSPRVDPHQERDANIAILVLSVVAAVLTLGESAVAEGVAAEGVAAEGGAELASISTLRQAAVRQAWAQERNLLEEAGLGTRNWTNSEIDELLSTGKVKGYQGDHINSVSAYPELAGNPNNIRFLTPSEHFEVHDCNWTNPTFGPLIFRQ